MSHGTNHQRTISVLFLCSLISKICASSVAPTGAPEDGMRHTPSGQLMVTNRAALTDRAAQANSESSRHEDMQLERLESVASAAPARSTALSRRTAPIQGWPEHIPYIPGRACPDHPSLFIAKSSVDGAGLGLFASELMLSGTFLGQYTGKIRFTDTYDSNAMNCYRAVAGRFSPFHKASAKYIRRGGVQCPPRAIEELITAFKSGKNNDLSTYYAMSAKDLTQEQLVQLESAINDGHLKPYKGAPWYSSDPEGNMFYWEISIDAAEGGAAARFANVPPRGKLPNATFKADEKNAAELYLVTTSPIRPGEEIFISYGSIADDIIQNGGKPSTAGLVRIAQSRGQDPLQNRAIVARLILEAPGRHQRNADEIGEWLEQRQRLRAEQAARNATELLQDLSNTQKSVRDELKKERGVRLGIFKAFAKIAFAGENVEGRIDSYKKILDADAAQFDAPHASITQDAQSSEL